jgi:hypothetical protein
MTQLNLSGRQLNDTQQKPAAKNPAAKNEDESIKNQTVGALGALAMFAAVIVIGSCSRSIKPVAVQQPVQPTAPVSAPAPAVPPQTPTPAPVVAKAKKHRAPTLSYVNREYGVSFTFPRNYRLKTQLATKAETNPGNEAKVAATTTEPLQMNFAHPGGLPLAAVEMPGNSYPGTDFKSGFVTLSVNPGMTAETCSQFGSTESSTITDPPTSAKIEPVKFGATEFDEIDNHAGSTMKQADAKYYHTFNNGVCYEFALAIATDNGEEITPVDRQGVFAKLEKILATVKFQPAVLPETHAPVPAVATTSPADSSNTTSPEAAAPNF